MAAWDVHAAANGQRRDRLERLAVRVGEAERAVGRDHQRVAWAEMMLVAVDRGDGTAGEDDEDLLAVDGVLAAASARGEGEPPDAGLGGAAARPVTDMSSQGGRVEEHDFGILLGLAYQAFKVELHRALGAAGFDDVKPSFGLAGAGTELARSLRPL